MTEENLTPAQKIRLANERDRNRKREITRERVLDRQRLSQLVTVELSLLEIIVIQAMVERETEEPGCWSRAVNAAVDGTDLHTLEDRLKPIVAGLKPKRPFQPPSVEACVEAGLLQEGHRLVWKRARCSGHVEFIRAGVRTGPNRHSAYVYPLDDDGNRVSGMADYAPYNELFWVDRQPD